MFTEEKSSKKSLNAYLIAFVISFSIAYLETVYLQIVNYVSGSYVQGLLVVSFVLAGLSTGGLASFQILRKRIELNLPLLTIFFSLAIITSFILVAFGFDYSGLPITVPFFVGGIIVTYILSKWKINLIYFCVLLGSGFGILFVVLFLQIFGAENLVLIAALINSLLAFLIFFFDEKGKFAVISLVLLVAFFAIVYFNLITNALDLAKTYPCARTFRDPFCVNDYNKKFNNTLKISTSRWGIISRIDILEVTDLSVGTFYQMYDNGWPTLPITSNIHQGVSSVPSPTNLPYALLTNPRVLVMGPNAGGKLKSAKAANASKIVGVEINPVVVSLMENEFLNKSGNAYALATIETMDGRTYIKKTTETFDLIAFYDTILFTPNQYAGIPSYLFTKEAFADYFKHLSKNGMIVIESNPDKMNQILASSRAAMKELNYTTPDRHFFIYDFTFDGAFFMNDTSRVYFLIVKNNPFSNDEIEILKEKIHNFNSQPGSNPSYIWYDGSSQKLIFKSQAYLSDDKPYFTFDKEYGEKVLEKFLLVCIPIFFFIFFLISRIPKNSISVKKFPYLLFFAALGTGYFILEISLMQKFYLFLGGPVYSFAVVLSSFLIFGGLGSYFSQKIQLNRINFIFVLIVLLMLVNIVFLEKITISLLAHSELEKIVISLIILFPLTFLIGMPFPMVLSQVKRDFGDSFVSLMWTINSIFSVVGSVFTLWAVTIIGYSFSSYIGLLAYLSALIFSIYILKSRSNDNK